MADSERVETESMPLTERYTPSFDTGMQPKAEPVFIKSGPPPRRRGWLRRKSAAATDQPDSAVIPTAYAETDALPSQAFPNGVLTCT